MEAAAELEEVELDLSSNLRKRKAELEERLAAASSEIDRYMHYIYFTVTCLTRFGCSGRAPQGEHVHAVRLLVHAVHILVHAVQALLACFLHGWHVLKGIPPKKCTCSTQQVHASLPLCYVRVLHAC